MAPALPSTHRRPSRPVILFSRYAAVTLIAAYAIAATPAAAAVMTTLHTSPTGSGTACSSAQPCTLSQAQTAVRAIAPSMTGDIVVQIAAGTYPLSSPLTFTAADSGTNGYTVYWQAASGTRPVISGGQKVTGWSVADSAQNIWRASVSGTFDTRQLYIDGRIATRARTQVNRGDFTFTTSGMTFTNGALSYLNNVAAEDRVELESVNSFTDRYVPVQSINNNAITMEQPAWGNNTWGYDTLSRPFHNGPMYLTNAREFLDTAGEWYLDTTAGMLYYKPLSGENMATADVQLPRLESLLRVGGTYTTPAHHISFSGLQFSHTSWLQPNSSQGYADQQTGAYIHGTWARPADWLTSCQSGCPAFEATRPHWRQMPAAVQVSAANAITLSNNRFTNLGQVGLGIGNDANAHATGVGLGASDIDVIGNVFEQIAAGAVIAGGVQSSTPQQPVTIVGGQSGRCIDVPSASTTNGTQTQLWDCNGASNQRWTYTAGKQLMVYGNKCLDATGQGTSNGTRLVIWDCNGQANQQWSLRS